MSAKSRKSNPRDSSNSGRSKFTDASEELRSVLAALEREREAEREEFRREWLELSLTRRRALGVTLYPLEFVEATGTLGGRWKLRFRFQENAGDGTGGGGKSKDKDQTKSKVPGGARFGRGHRFQSGQVVQLFRAGAEGESNPGESISGVLAEIRPHSFRLVLIADDAPDWLEDGRIGINLAFNETTYREMERALRDALDNNKIVSRRDRLLGYSPANKLHIPGDESADEAAEKSAGEAAQESTGEVSASSGLNAAQSRAVRGVRALSAGDFAVIHGPPGTGKTTTVVAAIVALLARGERVLVTAPTNAAVDLLAERLLAAFASGASFDSDAGDAGDAASQRKALSKIKLLRLGHPARVSEAVWRHTLEGHVDAHPDAKTTARYRAEADELYRKARKFRRNFGPQERAERAAMLKEHAELRRLIREMEQGIVQHIVETADVVVTTLVGATSKRIDDLEFDCAVIDEATQALEPAAWIAVLRAKKLVMAGDHRQLPPTVKAAPELSNTLFEKVITRHADADCVFFLDTQYRMRPEIVSFSNREFYDDRLITDESVNRREASAGDAGAESDSFLSGATPLIFIDTAGCDFIEELDPDSESYRNSGEARLLAAVLEQAASPALQRGWSIGVIATYRNQVSHLREALVPVFEAADADGDDSENEFSRRAVEVDTVDAFQGRENDIVCISMVRSNDSGETGFLGETRRMNVALTRARRYLIVVGDSATLANHPFYARFLEHVDSHGDYRSAYEFLEIV